MIEAIKNARVELQETQKTPGEIDDIQKKNLIFEKKSEFESLNKRYEAYKKLINQGAEKIDEFQAAINSLPADIVNKVLQLREVDPENLWKKIIENVVNNSDVAWGKTPECRLLNLIDMIEREQKGMVTNEFLFEHPLQTGKIIQDLMAENMKKIQLKLVNNKRYDNSRWSSISKAYPEFYTAIKNASSTNEIMARCKMKVDSSFSCVYD